MNGGGLACSGASAPTLDHCLFVENTASEMTGAAILCEEGSDATLLDCTFAGNTANDSGGAVACMGSAPVIEGCTFTGNTALQGSGGAVFSGWGGAPLIASCTMAGNAAALGAGVMCYQDAFATIERTIIAFSGQGNAVFCFNASAAVLSCCDLFGNPGGDWVGSIAGQLGAAGNICADPLFCGDAHAEAPYTLHEDSPCAAAQQPSCGGLGAWPVGCGGTTTSVSGPPPPVGPQADAEAGGAETAAAVAPRIRLARAVPNPMRAGTRIEYYVAEEAAAAGAPARLRIVDAAGRLVRVLAGGTPAAGAAAAGAAAASAASGGTPAAGGWRAVAWDGRDTRGRRVAAGVYFYTLEAGGERLARKLTVAR